MPKLVPCLIPQNAPIHEPFWSSTSMCTDFWVRTSVHFGHLWTPGFGDVLLCLRPFGSSHSSTLDTCRHPALELEFRRPTQQRPGRNGSPAGGRSQIPTCRRRPAARPRHLMKLCGINNLCRRARHAPTRASHAPSRNHLRVWGQG